MVGDSRTTYRNRKAIKAHGAKWNKEAQQWQATEPEAVARLREWFGVSNTLSAEENGTTSGREPQPEEQAQERPERGEGKPDALAMLKSSRRGCGTPDGTTSATRKAP